MATHTNNQNDSRIVEEGEQKQGIWKKGRSLGIGRCAKVSGKIKITCWKILGKILLLEASSTRKRVEIGGN